MSLIYKLAATAVKALDIKKKFRLPLDELLALVETSNQKSVIKIKPAKDLAYLETDIEGARLIVISPTSQRVDRAVLYLYGGGYLLAPRPAVLKYCEKIARASGRAVYFLFYPLITDSSLLFTHEVVLKTYERMLEKYTAEKISFLGASSGSVLAISSLLYNQETNRYPMPEQVIALSPGAMYATAEEEKRMEALAELDLYIDSQYFKTIETLLPESEGLPTYMLNPPKGDYTNFPPTHFYYGGHEVLYAFQPSYEAAFKKYKRQATFHIGEGLCHCYPLLHFFSEGRQAHEEIVALLKD